MTAAVDVERVRDAGRGQLGVQLLVLREETGVAVADVERDRRVQPLDRRARCLQLLMDVVVGAEVEGFVPVGSVGWK
ncbi:MAG TPA: hypothetical protein VGH82_09450 [Gaiellaceae bacterium]